MSSSKAFREGYHPNLWCLDGYQSISILCCVLAHLLIHKTSDIMNKPHDEACRDISQVLENSRNRA